MQRGRHDLPAERRHIAIIGFMGAGKSSVGRALAEKLGAPFVDLDELIVKKAGRSIPELFREHGEVGFRAHERAALREVLKSDLPVVLATGGGTFVDPSMRGWVQRAARTVYLKASPEVIAARVGAGEGRAARPLLSGPDPMATIKRLLNERGPAYELCDVTVTTDKLSCDEVVHEVMNALRSERTRAPLRAAAAPGKAEGRQRELALKARVEPVVAAPVEPQGAAAAEDEPVTTRLTLGPGGTALLRVEAAQGSYAVELRADAGAWLGEAITSVCPGERLAIISDETVAPLHADKLRGQLEARGRVVSVHTFPAGEASKTLMTAAHLYDVLLEGGLGREDAVIALGGGVVGDVTGFVASTFLRGVAFVQVPTTTLAAVDACVGGKTAVNTPRGKNLVGTFYPPKAVLIAVEHLATQPRRAHAAGLVEALKIGATMDEALCHSLLDDAAALLDFEAPLVMRVIARALAHKADVVSRDERERGERVVLNYGHTIGHAIERGESYRLLHGEAVALGMLAEAAWAEHEGLAGGVVSALGRVLERLEVPTDWRAASVDIAALGLDKKRAGQNLRLPIVQRLGSYDLRAVPLGRLTSFLENRSK